MGSYMGVGYSGYEVERCPKCGELMWNGQCENLDCEYHWYPMDDEGERFLDLDSAEGRCLGDITD